MHIRRLAAFLLGAWMAGSVAMVLVASHNLNSVDLMVTAPPTFARYSIEALGPRSARNLLQFQAAELNRFIFDVWELMQMGIGAALLLCLLSGKTGRVTIALCTLMLVAVVALHFAISPPLTRLGRLTDFAPASRASVDRDNYWRFHATYSGIDAAKGLFGLMLLSSLLRPHGAPAPGAPQKKWRRAR